MTSAVLVSSSLAHSKVAFTADQNVLSSVCKQPIGEVVNIERTTTADIDA